MKILSFVLVLSGGLSIYSYSSRSGADFLNFEPSSRSQGLGGAASASITDITGMNINPASIAFIREPQVSYMHQATLSEFSTEYLSMGLPLAVFFPSRKSLPKKMRWLRNVRVGFSFLYFYTPSFEIVGNDSNEAQSIANVNDLFGSLALGYNLLGYRLGLAFKFINRRLVDFTTSTIAFDLGALKGFELNALRFLPYPVRYNIKVALSLTNAGPGIEFAGLSEALPLNIKTGLSYGLFGSSNHLIDFNLGTSTILNEATYLNMGFEYRVFKFFFFRTGIEFGPGQFQENSFTLGTGLRYTFRKVTYRVDYAYLPRRNNVTDNHSFSLLAQLHFLRPRKRKRVTSLGILDGSTKKKKRRKKRKKKKKEKKIEIR